MVMMYRAVTFNFVKLIKHGVFNLNTDFKMPIKNKKCKKKNKIILAAYPLHFQERSIHDLNVATSSKLGLFL